jgi:hypothetical protein
VAQIEGIEQFAVEELESFKVTALARLAVEIRRRNLVLSGELLQSLAGEVAGQAATSGAQLFLAFKESGRIQDMKRVQYRKLPNIEALEAWVRKVGYTKFNVPGYTKSRPFSQQKAITRIAWGIALHRFETQQHTPRKWFARPFYALITPLIDRLVTRAQEHTGQTVAAGFDF